MDKDMMESKKGVIRKKKGRKEGLYDKQRQILHNNKQWASELIKHLHYQIQH